MHTITIANSTPVLHNSMVRIEAWQINSDISENSHLRFNRVCNQLDKVSKCDFLVLPELWAEGAFNLGEARDHSQDFELDTLFQIAALKKMWIWTGTFLTNDDKKVKNRGFLVSPSGELILHYDKNKIFTISGNEGKIVSGGAEIPLILINNFRTAFLTCFDLRFSNIFEELASHGVELIVISAAWPLSRIDQWKILLAARAVECQAFVLGCNGEGIQLQETLGGETMMFDPNGVKVKKLPESRNNRMIYHVDRELLIESRQRFPFQQFRQTDRPDGNSPRVREYLE